MNFSIKPIIRALLAPDHKLRCPRATWLYTLGELHLRSEDRHEAGCSCWVKRRTASVW